MTELEWDLYCQMTGMKAASDWMNRTIIAYTLCNCSACRWRDNSKVKQITYKSKVNCTGACTDRNTGCDKYLDKYANILSKHNSIHKDLLINLLDMKTLEEVERKNESETKFIRIHKHNAEIFVDSGTYISVMNREFAELLNNNNQLISWNETTLDDMVIRDRNREIMTTSGRVTLQLMIGDQPLQCEFLVIDLLKRKCIIGREFIDKHKEYMDWRTCPMQFWNHYPMDLFCRNSTLKIRMEIQKHQSGPNNTEHWIIHIMRLHIGLDKCSYIMKLNIGQLERALSELLVAMDEGIGVELTTTNPEEYHFSSLLNFNKSLMKSDGVIGNIIHRMNWNENWKQNFGEKLGGRIDSRKKRTIVCTIPSLENLAVNSIITDEKHRRYVAMIQEQGSEKEKAFINNLFYRNIRHDMILTCTKWKFLSTFDHCHSYIYQREMNRGLRQLNEHEICENIQL